MGLYLTGRPGVANLLYDDMWFDNNKCEIEQLLTVCFLYFHIYLAYFIF